MFTEYLDFKIEVQEKQGRNYPIFADSPEGKESGFFCHPFPEDELNKILESMRIFHSDCNQHRDFGKKLFDALFKKKIRTLYEDTFRAAGRDEKGLRIILQIEPFELSLLPWELLCDDKRHGELALVHGTSIVRKVPLLRPVNLQPTIIKAPLKILIIIACPIDEDVLPFDTLRQKLGIEMALKGLLSDGSVKLDFLLLEEATDEKLQEKLQEDEFHVIYFVGHGIFDKEKKMGFLLFENPAGNKAPIDTVTIRFRLEQSNVKVVILNSCETAKASSPNSAIAQSLSSAGIPVVIGMQQEMPVFSAPSFAKGFFTALANSYPIDECVSTGRIDVRAKAGPDKIDWAIPVLFMQSLSGIVFQMEEATTKARTTRKKEESISPEEMVLILAGNFIKGSDESAMRRIIESFGLDVESNLNFLTEEKKGEGYLPAFYIDKYPVTNAKYKDFVITTGYKRPCHWKDEEPFFPKEKENHPVVNISWNDAVAYCMWAGKRLPSELEWEKASRGTDGRTYPWGNNFDELKCNCGELDSEDTVMVGKYENGRSPYGIYDMAGNVCEWTSTDERGYKVIKGGSWRQTGEIYCLTSLRPKANPELTRDDIGFRCAKDV